MEHYRGFAFPLDVDPTLDSTLRARFVPTPISRSRREFIDRCVGDPHGKLRTWAHRVLRTFVSDFDANGLLAMYPMHLLDSEQFASLVGREFETGLDVGAGNGDVSTQLLPLVGSLTVTEGARAMRRLLRRRGFRVLETELDRVDEQFQLVSCLNVLDRTARPGSLVRSLAKRLAPDGNLVLSVPLPLAPFYYRGAVTLDPEQPLPTGATTFEESLTLLVRWLEMQLPALSLQAFTRAPYLSGGDCERPLYPLDAAVLVLGPGPERPVSAPTDQSSIRT